MVSIRKTHFHQVRNHEALGVGTTFSKMVSIEVRTVVSTKRSTTAGNDGHHAKHPGWHQTKQMVGI